MRNIALKFLLAAGIAVQSGVWAMPVPPTQMEGVRLNVEHGRYSKAVEELHPLLVSFPDDGVVHYYLAVCLHHLGKTREAVNEYGKVLECSSDAVLKDRCEKILCYFSKLGLTPAKCSETATASASANVQESKNAGSYYLPQGIKLVYFYNPACKTCKAYSVTFDKVKTRFSSTLECISLDMGAPENKRLVTDYEIEYYPTTMVLNDKGSEVGRASGALEEPALESFVNKNMSKCLKKRA